MSPGLKRATPIPIDTVEPEIPEMPETPDAEGSADARHWQQIVDRIRVGDNDALAELYRVFSRGVRFTLCRQLGSQDLDDKVHDIFVIVVEAIRKSELRDPARLMGFIRTVVRRQIAGHIDRVVKLRRDSGELEDEAGCRDERPDPEDELIRQQEAQIAYRVLQEVSDKDREILTRFYLNEQSQDQICFEMNLSETQFRLLKSRAKARFGELGRKHLKNSKRK